MGDAVEYELVAPRQSLRHAWMSQLDGIGIAERIASEKSMAHDSVRLIELVPENYSGTVAQLEEDLDTPGLDGEESVYERVRSSLPADCHDASIRVVRGGLVVQWRKERRFKLKHLAALCALACAVLVLGLVVVIAYCNDSVHNCTRINARHSSFIDSLHQ